MTTKNALIIACIIIVGLIVCDSDWYQKEFYPKTYWSKRVIALENAVSTDKAMFRDAAIELKKIKVTAPLRVAQEINFAESHGLSRDEAEKTAVEMIRSEIQDMHDELDLWEEQTKNDRDELEKARSQLLRYK